MGAARRHQLEVEKVLKKLGEGFQDFEALWEKWQKAHDNEQNLMLQDKTVEKTLKDLKTELKKLQRLREQTRAFLAAPETDPKFTAVLQKARRDVELKMEAFKVVEKQHKIKAFFTAGLAQAKEDPGARAKLACEEWLSNSSPRRTRPWRHMRASSRASRRRASGRRASARRSSRSSCRCWGTTSCGSSRSSARWTTTRSPWPSSTSSA